MSTDDHRYALPKEGPASCTGCAWKSRPIGISSLTQHEEHRKAVAAAADQPTTEPSGVERDTLARLIARAQNADGFYDEIQAWESQEDWEREAHPDNYPDMAYEDLAEYQNIADRVLSDLSRLAPAPQPAADVSDDDPIPRYAQLDVWMALYGSHRSEEYEPYRDQHGFALTWANLCHEIRVRASQPAADTLLRDRLAEVLGDDVYVVGRVWEAWSHGTMTADDFTLATETDVLDDLVAAATLPAADTETEVQWGVRNDETGEVVKGWHDSARRYVTSTGEGTLMKRTVTTTPWEEA